MWECEYSREPVDYRLLWLKFLRKTWILPLAVLAGAVLAGAWHYYARIWAQGGRTYQAESIFYVEFAEDAQGKKYDYYNYFTWEDVIHTDFFLESAHEKMAGELSVEEITSYVRATILSDTRYLYVYCNTHSPELSVRLATVMEEVLPGFADIREEIRAIEVAKAGDTAIDSSKLRLWNAFCLGGGLGLGTAVLWILIALILDPAVYLPSTIEKRYHIKCLGAVFMPEFASNWNYVLEDAESAAVVFVDEGFSDENFLDKNFVTSAEKENKSEKRIEEKNGRKITNCRNPAEHPEELDRIRKCEKVLLALRAGCRNNKAFERLIEQLARQDIRVSAVILDSADKKLLASYYRSRF